MKKILIVLSILIISSTSNALPAMQADNSYVETKPTNTQYNILKPIKVQVLKWNMYINKEIPKYMKSLKHNPSMAVIFTALLAAFVYGIFHTLGPGHGKMVVATYFLTQNASFLQGVWLGVQTAFAHVGGAIILVLSTDFALKNLVLDQEKHMYLLKNISFSLIICVGLFMFINAVLHAMGKVKSTGCSHCNAKMHKHSHEHHHHDHDHEHKHDNHHHHDHSHKHEHSVQNTKKDTFIALSIGLIPCTGSLLILLYAMANDIMLFGLMMVIFVALGMALTMILLGICSILGKKKILDVFFKNKKSSHSYTYILELFGASFIIFIGSVLLWVNM